ncbi:MAG: hypothetical protein HY290_30435 [Planctomycetia bacterium]|nr:hypothetical protein [Planctomycetia bacterium]
MPPSPIALVRSAWQKSLARANQIEGVQMVTAVLAGSDMGPGEGWFHAGQSRYGWPWLAERYDQNRDGVITADEFSGPAAMFERLDRDKSGEIKADDFDWSDAAPFIRQQGQAGQWFARFDKSSNGRITPDEWQQFFEKLAGEKGYVSREDLRMGLFPPAPKTTAPPAPGQDGPSRETLLLGILSGELGSLFEGPRIDQQAPDFELESQDHKQRIRLSSYHDEKPVVLVFGSFT